MFFLGCCFSRVCWTFNLDFEFNSVSTVLMYQQRVVFVSYFSIILWSHHRHLLCHISWSVHPPKVCTPAEPRARDIAGNIAVVDQPLIIIIYKIIIFEQFPYRSMFHSINRCLSDSWFLFYEKVLIFNTFFLGWMDSKDLVLSFVYWASFPQVEIVNRIFVW